MAFLSATGASLSAAAATEWCGCSGAINMIQGAHNYTQNFNTTIAAALNQGGIDVNCAAETPSTPEICAQLYEVDLFHKLMWTGQHAGIGEQ